MTAPWRAGAVIVAGMCGLMFGLGCGCPKFWNSGRVINTNVTELAGAGVYFYAGEVEVSYEKVPGGDLWTATFAVVSVTETEPVDTADSADTALP